MGLNPMGTKGFTLLEIIIVLAIAGLLTGGTVTLTQQVLKKEREDKTIEHLKRLKVAIAGDPLTVHQEVRTSFGYFGDMGILPSTLEDLYTLGTQTPYSFNASLKTGYGWNGPYLDPELIEYFNELDEDYFDQALRYETAGLPSGIEGRIRSLGRDKVEGTSDDLTVEFSTDELYSRVYGLIKDGEGNGVSGATVRINYPVTNGGTTSLTTTVTATTDTYGFYSFNNVPYGNHSLSITAPRLFLASGTGQTMNNATAISFFIINTSSSSITLSTLRADFSINPTVYYEKVTVGGQPVFNSTNPRASSGQTVTFTNPVSIAPASVAPEAVAICVQSPVTEVSDIDLTRLGLGSATEVTLEGFNDSQIGPGTGVNITGVVFTITFSDGSVITFIP